MNAIANAFAQLLNQISPQPRASERKNATNSYDRNLALVWGKLPAHKADSSLRMIKSVAIESLSARMYSLIDRAVEDGTFLVGLVGDNADSDQMALADAKYKLATELKCIGQLGFVGKSGDCAVDEYVRRLNDYLQGCSSEYRIQLSANRKSCTVSNVVAAPARYVSFDCCLGGC